jgi:hypothetical protein
MQINSHDHTVYSNDSTPFKRYMIKSWLATPIGFQEQELITFECKSRDEAEEILTHINIQSPRYAVLSLVESE